MGVQPRIDDLVIVLPGITGSVLMRDGRDVWAPSAQAIWGAIKSGGGSISDLTLADQDDPDLDDLGDGIVADRLVGTAHMLPGVTKIDGYTALIEMIRRRFFVKPGDRHDPSPANLYEFAYDWRRDIRVAARQLSRFADDRLQVWREWTGNQSAKIILLAHSMGGIVARYYLEILGGAVDARALVTFGTPYRGAPQAIDALANGVRKAWLDLTPMVRSLTSVYQLLPIYRCIETPAGHVRIGDVADQLGLDAERVNSARQMHVDVQAAAESRPGPSYVVVPFLGFGQQTVESATLVDKSVTMHREPPSWIDDRLRGGDGTVPRVSATPIELSEVMRDTFVAARHSSLHVSGQVLDDLEQRLRGMAASGLSSIRGPDLLDRGATEATVSLDVGDLFTTDESIVCGLDVHGAAGPPSAKVAPLDGSAAAVQLDVEPVGNRWQTVLQGLQPGVYRITADISGVAAGRIHDVFEVIE